MRKNSIVKILSVLLLVALLFSGAPLGASAEKAAPQQAVVVEQAVLEEIQANGTASYMINFKYDVDLSPAFTMNWVDRGWFVYNTLVAQRDSTQAAVQEYLSNAKVEYTSFWINNSISVKQSDNVILNAIQSFEGVESITAPKVMYLAEPTLAGDSELMAIEPNISHVKATDVWGMGITGEGFTVANIDTGVRYTHEAVVNQYRGNDGGTFSHDYNWLDPYPSAYQAPRDDNGHGSHTMGTMVGKVAENVNQIGMAPGATWMACRGCDSNQCAGDQLLACAQWVAAPTKMDGSGVDTTKRPVAVNNSWGDCDQTYDDWYQEVVDAWVAAGIYPVFSNGNNSNCYYPVNPPEGTVGNPARYGNVSGVGSTGQSNATYAGHSNKGPSDVADTINPIDGSEFVKPQFMAPGVAIRSSLNGSDTQYASYNGTSMSAPHVTGLIALIREAAPCLEDYGQIETLIQNTATEIDPAPGHTGGVPNNSVGWGEINALAAVDAAMGMCGDETLKGTVKSNAEGNPPIAGAKVVITPVDESAVRTVTTNANGEYEANVDAGTYDMVASKMGYLDKAENGVVVEAGVEKVVDFILEALPAKIITGTITDGGVEGGQVHGYPLMATLVFSAADHEFTTMSDPFTGKYTVTLYDNTDYDVVVTASNPGYYVAERSLVDTFALVQDFELFVDNGACNAPGYQGAGVTEGFDEGLPAGWTIHNYGTGGVWHFNDPSSRGNQTGGTGIFAMVDSDYYGSGQNQNTGLRTPVLDFSASTAVSLEFKSYYRTFSNQFGRIKYSLDGGINWTEYFTLPATTEQMNYSFDLTAILAGQSNVMIEFFFQASWGYYWQVDDVKISDGTCFAADGGAVAGYVIDGNVEDLKLMGAKVETENNSKTTAANTFEPANGLYWFFEKTETDPQDVEFTVSKPQYETLVENVSIVQSELTRHDFTLGSGLLSVEPLLVERTLWLNDDDEFHTIHVMNEGSGGADFALSEVNMGFQPLYIPPFEGELEAESQPASMLKDPSTPTTQLSSIADANVPKPMELFGGSLAYVVEIRSNEQLYRIPDLDVPGTWEAVAPMTQTFYAGDFLGSDFSKIYGVNENDVLYTIDTATGAYTQIASLTLPGGGGVQGISGAQGFFYGSTSTCGGSTQIFKMTPEGAVEMLGETNIQCGIDLAYVPDNGLIYIVDIVTDHLYSFDPVTKATVDIGALGFAAGYAQGMDYDEVNKILYWAAYGSGGNGQLRVIDMNTGASALVGPFTGDNESDCLSIAAGGAGGGGAVPWLDENPYEGYVPAGRSFPVELQFTVRDVIDQPGDYFAQLRFTSNTPHEIQPVDVIMHVLRPFTWGNIKGNVIASEKCDVNPAPLEEATVNFYKDGAIVKATVTDADGYYSYALERGTYDVEVVMAGYVSARVNGVVLGNSEDIVVDLALRHDSPCLTYTPESFFAQQYPDQITQQILTFTNTGAQDAIFEISEVVGDSEVPYSMAPVELILDDGSAENGVGIGGNSQFIWINRFTPTPDQFPFTLETVQVYWDSTSMIVSGDPFELLFYSNTTGGHDPAPGSQFISKVAVTATSLGAWQTYTLEPGITFEGPGDVLIGVAALKKPGSDYWPASIDETSTKQRSWAGWWSTDIPNPPTLPPNESWTLIDAYFPGNWLIRGFGETGGGGGTPGDIPWLTEDPTAGVVFADGGSVDVTLEFDSTGLRWGDYFGALSITNAPDPKITIPVQLRVLPFNMMYLPLILRNFN